MNRLQMVCWIVVAGGALLVVAGRAPDKAQAGTVVHWRFEEGVSGAVASGAGSVLDSSLNGYHGTPSGDDGPVYRADVALPPPPTALSCEFDGINDRVVIPGSDHQGVTVPGSYAPAPALNLLGDPFTLEASFLIDSFTEDRMSIIAREETGLGFTLLVQDDSTLWFYSEAFAGTPTNNIVSPVGSVETGVWHKAAVTFTGSDGVTPGTVSMYLDGDPAPVATDSWTYNGRLGTSTDLLIGNAIWGGGRWFSGKMDEIRVSSAALPYEQLLMAGGTDQTATEAYWRFEEGVAGNKAGGVDSVLDSSGNGYHGTPNGLAGPVYDNDVASSPPAGNLSLAFDPQSFAEDVNLLGAPFTLEASFLIDSYSEGHMAIIAREQPGSGFTLLARDDGAMLFYCEAYGPNHIDSPPGVLQTGVWHKAAICSDGTTVSMYLDGDPVPVATMPWAYNGKPGTDADILIGNSIWGAGRWFDGKIDEIRISDECLPFGQLLMVPEPTSLALALIGAACVGAVTGLRQRRRKERRTR